MSPQTMRYVLAWSLAFNVAIVFNYQQLHASAKRLVTATEELYGNSQRCMALVERCDGLLDRWEALAGR